MLFPLKVTCTVKSRKSAHGASKGGRASFPAVQEAPTVEESVKLMSEVFPSEDGYKIEVEAAS